MSKTAKAPKKALTKSAVHTHLSEATGLKKGEVVLVLDALSELIQEQLRTKNLAQFTLPGIARFKLKHFKAVKGGQQKINQLTKEPYITKDKPAHSKVKIFPVKALSEAVK